MRVFKVSANVRHKELGWNFTRNDPYFVVACSVEQAARKVRRLAHKPVIDKSDGNKSYRCLAVNVTGVQELCELD